MARQIPSTRLLSDKLNLSSCLSGNLEFKNKYMAKPAVDRISILSPARTICGMTRIPRLVKRRMSEEKNNPVISIEDSAALMLFM